jgi:hypothetical protein
MNPFIIVRNEILVRANKEDILYYDPNMTINTHYIVSIKSTDSKETKCYDIMMLKGMPIRVCDKESIKRLEKIIEQFYQEKN